MSNLALHDAHTQLNMMEDKFNALATVAGKEMARFVKPWAVTPITVGTAALAAASEAKFGTKGAIANAVLAGAAWVTGMFMGENADLRNLAYAVAGGLGSSAASIATYDKVTSMMAAKTAPAPAPAPVT